MISDVDLDVLAENCYNVIPEDEPEYQGPGEQEIEKPTKEEIKVAKWMKKHVKTKKTKFLNHNVEYFTSSKAIDALLKSKFAEGGIVYFSTREEVVEFLDNMLVHKFFHRAKKVPISIEDIRGGSGGTIKKEKISDKKDEAKKLKEPKKDNDGDAEIISTISGDGNGNGNGNGGGGGVSDEASSKSSSHNDKKEKRKRKIRLDMHPDQLFVDGSEAYVWIYDPIPVYYWIYGFILLLGAIGLCLFPLWPPMMRNGVYYLSMVAAGFLVFILALTILRIIVFSIVWICTSGTLHFWIFPNLTEDVGFFASFWPLYETNFVEDENTTAANADKKAKKSKKKGKDSDVEDNDETGQNTSPLEPEKIEEIKEHDADMELRLRTVTNAPNKQGIDDESHSGSSSAAEANHESDTKCSHTPSESESSDGSKDYEIINATEVHNVQ